MKTDLLIPRKAYMQLMSFMLCLYMTSNLVGQCYFTNCPSPPLVTIYDLNDGDLDCNADYAVTLFMAGCPDMSSNNVNFTLLDAPSGVVISPASPGASEPTINANSLGFTDADPEVTFVFEGLPLGEYQFEFEIGTTGEICRYDIVVQESSNLACNNDINISLDGNCQVEILTDMILEGSENCNNAYDLYTIEVEGFPPAQGMVVVDAPGNYTVTVTSPSGLSCWGTVEVEDKLSQALYCDPIEVRCSQTYAPGDPILDYKAFRDGDSGTVGVLTIDDMGDADPTNDVEVPGSASFEVDFTDCDPEDVMMDLQLILDIEVEDVNDVKAYLVKPNPLVGVDTLPILDLFTGNACTANDLHLELEDGAYLSHNHLTAAGNCGLGLNAGYCGLYQPFQSFGRFDGEQIRGVWTLIVENYSMDDPLTVDNFQMAATVGSGVVNFPVVGNNVTWIKTGDYEYNVVIANNNCGPYEAEYNDVAIGPECYDDGGNPLIRNVIRRTWKLTNGAGLTTECDQDITIRSFRIDKETPERSEIFFPEDYDGTADSYAPFICSDFLNMDGTLNTNLLDENGNPSPTVTGHPYTIFGDIYLCGNYQFTYNDIRLAICGDAYKVLRTWTLLDWCTGAVCEEQQVIKVVDVEAPVMVCAPATTNPNGVPSFLQNTDPYTCTATWTVERPQLVIDCGVILTDYDFDIAYLVADNDGNPPVDGEYITDNVNYGPDGNPVSISDLPVGATWLQYTVVDDCGNEGVCRTEIYTFDTSDPFAVCLEFTVATLGPDGCVRVNAKSFDNGSWDNCGPVTYDARLHEDNSNLFNYAKYLDFCCADCGKVYMVDLLVTDLSGNTSSCTVEIEVVDNLPPVVNAAPPSNITRTCVEGTITKEEIEAQYVGDFDIFDNCNTTTIPTIVSPDEAVPAECGDNSVVFKWEIGNSCGEPLVFNQILTFTNPSIPVVTYWPYDEEVNECVTLPTPDQLASGYPVVTNDDCSLLAVDYSDLIFNNVDDACIKILRTWTVINWCIYDPNASSPLGFDQHVQTIKIKDPNGPEIVCPADLTIEAYTDNCVVTTDEDALILAATDACTDAIDEDLVYEYVITQDGVVVASGNTNNANGTYPYGWYEIEWTVTDHCDNQSTCTYEFHINDAKKPTPYCLGTVVTATMEDPEADIFVWASDFDLGGTDNYTGNCNDNELKVFFIDTLGNEVPSLGYDCDDVPNGDQATIFIKLWYEDEYGNRDFCEVVLVLQDNENDACGDSGSRISGNVRTEEFDMVENVKVSIDAELPEFPESMYTSKNGKYEFKNLTQEMDYTITSERNDNLLNGVSTLDIVLIQKHILGVLPLSSAYKVIASDANNSGNVSAIDLIEIRKAILGITDEFANGQQSWRFVDANQNFPTLNNPFPFTEELILDNYAQSISGKDIIAVKIGDVNGSAIVNFAQEGPVVGRSTGLTLEVEEARLQAGERVEVPVYSSNFDNILGYQFTWNTDSRVELIDVVSGALTMDENNFGWNSSEKGMIATSWNAADAVSVDEDEVLFTLILDVNENGLLSQVLNINSDITSAEVYDSGLNIHNIELGVRTGELETFELFQNVPNPFDTETNISFRLPIESDIKLSVFDVTGKLIKTMSGTYDAGIHSVQVRSEEFNQATGVLYYQLETDGFIQTKKMIRLK